MGLKAELKRVVSFVEKHGSTKVLDALEGAADESLDALLDKVPDEFKILAKSGEQLAKIALHRQVTKLEKKLGEADEAQDG